MLSALTANVANTQKNKNQSPNIEYLMAKDFFKFNFLNNGIGARLKAGSVYRFLNIDGSTIVGKFLGIKGANNVIVNDGKAKRTIFTLFRTTTVENRDPSRKQGTRKKK